ncbi:Gti1/Pac2 family-domain-containing protein [Aspergillus egyptiacus]|nr:Gti1/Pac2 family-domain-containing protein [Aspergillus egyptiacus]
MVNGNTTMLEPTFIGHVATTKDALLLFEACLDGVLSHVPRRPHDRERSHLVRSGSVFIYEEGSSGIKRWTDGVTWSPSRILGNFLVYRELEKPFPPGEKKRAMKKTTRRPLPSGRPGEPYPRQDNNGGYSPQSATGGYGDRPPPPDVERSLVGSLVDSYGFKEAGLVKKTMSVTVNGVTHHLVSYYTLADAMRGVLKHPSAVGELRKLRIRSELTLKQSFRAPIDEADPLSFEDSTDAVPQLYSFRPPMMPTPSYPLQAPPQHTDYYVPPNPYTQVTHPAPTNGLPGFSMGGGLPSQEGYLPPPVQIPQQQRQDDYTQFRGQSSYGAGFEALGQGGLSSSMQSGIPSLPSSSISERARSQSDQSQSVYRNSSISSRSVATDTTSPIDPSTPGSFSTRGSFSLVGQMDGAVHPPLEHRGLGFDASVPRRDSAPMFYQQNERSHYYMTGQAPLPPHPAYPPTTWTATAGTPAQPQI